MSKDPLEEGQGDSLYRQASDSSMISTSRRGSLTSVPVMAYKYKKEACKLTRLSSRKDFYRSKTDVSDLSETEIMPLSGQARNQLMYGASSSEADDVENQSTDKQIEKKEYSNDCCGHLKYSLDTTWMIITGNWVNVLLVFLPFAWAAYFFDWGPVPIFFLNFIAIIPLASMLGDFTEELALYTGETFGGLINATFGNAVELIVGINALRADQIRVVQSSMLGSVLSNLLLVLGCCFFFGGIKYPEQEFNSTAASANMSLLLLSSLALVLPTPFAEYYSIENDNVLLISRIAAIFLLFMYIQLLFFQLKTHHHLFSGESGGNNNNNNNNINGNVNVNRSIAEREEEEEEEPKLPFIVAIIGLLLVTILVSIFSEFLVDSIDGMTSEVGMSKTFVGIILIPVVGNAVEHITAVTVAMKDKMELSMGVAVGSATQVSIFVVPFLVLAGWVLDKDMTLNFPYFEITLYTLSVLIVSNLVTNGRSNWLEGSLLLTTYILLGVAFWFEEVKSY